MRLASTLTLRQKEAISTVAPIKALASYLRSNVIDDDGDTEAMIALKDVFQQGGLARSLEPGSAVYFLLESRAWEAAYQETRQ